MRAMLVHAGLLPFMLDFYTKVDRNVTAWQICMCRVLSVLFPTCSTFWVTAMSALSRRVAAKLLEQRRKQLPACNVPGKGRRSEGSKMVQDGMGENGPGPLSVPDMSQSIGRDITQVTWHCSRNPVPPMVPLQWPSTRTRSRNCAKIFTGRHLYRTSTLEAQAYARVNDIFRYSVRPHGEEKSTGRLEKGTGGHLLSRGVLERESDGVCSAHQC